jgi:hypothetical protein
MKRTDLRKWDIVKNNVHDVSGIENPENWMYERVDGIFYPVEELEIPKGESEVEKRMFDLLDPDMTDEEIMELGWEIKYSSEVESDTSVNYRENCGHKVV